MYATVSYISLDLLYIYTTGINHLKKVKYCLFSLGDSPGSDVYMPTFRNTLSVPSSKAPAFEDGTDSVFRNVGIYKSDAGESPKIKQTTRIILFEKGSSRLHYVEESFWRRLGILNDDDLK